MVQPRQLAPLLFLVSACASGPKRDPVVPDETQRRSEEMYGQQGQTMNSLNQTPSEQAGARHENATRPAPRDEPSGESREK
jgi:hypothetical protein